MTFFNALVVLCGAAFGTIVILIPAVTTIAHTAATL